MSSMSVPSSSVWFLRRPPQARVRLRLFCFPHAGGGVAAFRGWSDRLPPDVEVCAIQLPGRDARMREPLCADLDTLIHALATGLSPFLDVPFALFGHSLGALVAFELTRHLRRGRGPMPVHLLMSGRRAPQLPHVDPPSYHLPEPAFVDVLVKRYNGLPPAILAEPELMAMFLPVLRADLKMTETYQYSDEDPLALPISAFGGLEDRIAGRADLAPWQDLTSGPFTLHMLPGGHFYMQASPDALLRLVSRQLAL